MSEPSLPFPLITYRTKYSPIIPLLPVLAISMLTGFFYQELDFTASFFNGEEGDYGLQAFEGILLVIIAILGGFLIVFAMKKKKIIIIQILYALGLTVSTGILAWLHGYFLEVYYFEGQIWIEIISGILGGIVGLGALFSLIFRKGNQIVRNSLVLTLSVIMGTMFGLLLPTITFLILIILVSLFDIYSVFKGPINQMFQENGNSFITSIKPETAVKIDVGIGDFVFYSSLVTFVGKELGIVLACASFLGIIVGMKITERMLIKYQRFPGLPIPIFIALLLVGIGYLVFTYLVPVQ